MEIIQLLVFVGVVGLIIFCSSRVAKSAAVPLKEKGSRWALSVQIGAFVVSFVLLFVGMFFVLTVAFGR